mgnify:CR=1 FL=1
MKYLCLLLLSFFLFLSCSSVNDSSDPDMVIGTRIKVFSSCDEIFAIASDIIYDRTFDDVNSYTGDERDPKFSCTWTETWRPDNPDIFVGSTRIYSGHDIAEVSRDYFLDREGHIEVVDQRLQTSKYSNVLIMKSFSEAMKTQYYSLYVWGESKRVSRVIADDLSWAESPSPQLDDAAIVNMFLAMLESAD